MKMCVICQRRGRNCSNPSYYGFYHVTAQQHCSTSTTDIISSAATSTPASVGVAISTPGIISKSIIQLCYELLGIINKSIIQLCYGLLTCFKSGWPILKLAICAKQ